MQNKQHSSQTPINQSFKKSQQNNLTFISQSEYKSLLNKIQQLEIQNKLLQQKLSHYQSYAHQIKQDSQETIPAPKTTFIKKSNKNQSQNIVTPQQIKQSWVQWSKTIQQNKKFRDLVFNSQASYNSTNSTNSDNYKNQNQPNDPLHLIEEICIYGPNQEQILKSQNRAFSVSSQLHYPQSQRFQQYATYFSSEQIPVKKVRPQKQATQTNRIIFKKNPNKNDTAVFLFQAQQNHCVTNVSKNNELLNKVNPGKRLFVFSIPFYDFLTYEKDNQQKSIDDVCLSQRTLEDHDHHIDIKMLKKLSLASQMQDKQKNKHGNWRFFASKFYLCLFTYFPLVNLFQKVLLRIMDIIKIRRMELFTQNPSKINLIDFKYIKKQIGQLTNQMMNSINSIPSQLNNTKYVQLGHQNYLINLSQENLINQIYQNWVSQCLKHFTKDTLYEVICYMLMQESLCFVSEDLHTLTYMILLFSDLLIRPLSSPHPIISVAFKQELLGTPFIVNMGVHKSTKWLQQNSDLFADNKVIINLNEQMMIKSRKKPKFVKSNKVKQIITSALFKKKDLADSIPNFFRRKQSLSKTSTQEENQNAITFVNALKKYFQDQIIVHLPSKQLIKQIKKEAKKKRKQYSIQKTGQNTVQKLNENIIQSNITSNYEQGNNIGKWSTIVLQYVQKFFRQSRKIGERDALIDNICEQQLFYVYLCDNYGLK